MIPYYSTIKSRAKGVIMAKGTGAHKEKKKAKTKMKKIKKVVSL
jgi:hypothetical protein